MIFSSPVFLFSFLPCVLLLYYLSPRKLRNFVLFVSSLFFYLWGEPVYLWNMLFTVLFGYLCGICIEKARECGKKSLSKAVLIASAVVNLGVLGFFKYGNFFLSNLNFLIGTKIGLLDIALPIGISFYTFQTMSYTIDVYRGETAAQKNPINFGAYVTMFPQLVAGPIVQYRDIESRLSYRRETVDAFAYGIRRFITGLFKKAVLANSVGLLWERISAADISILPAATAWLGAVAFSFQIYFDFSAYSDMAIGLGEMFGFHFRENFNLPYRSRSITEFWRRWHISLGAWFRDYVYIPLGGSRKGLPRQIFNLLVVWALTGFWHGASWNFVLWGLYFGVLLIFEKVFLLRRLTKAPGWVGNLYTLFFVVVGWVLFAFEDVSAGIGYMKAMVGLNGAGFFNPETLYLLGTNLLLLLVCGLLGGGVLQKFRKKQTDGFLRNLVETVCLVLLFLVSVAFLVGDTYNPFLYFRF